MSVTASWPQTHLVDLLSARAQRHPERAALRFLTPTSHSESSEALLSYGDLHAQALAVAAQLSLHAEPGERALLLYPSGQNYVIALLGCFYAGIVAVPAYPPQSLAARHLSRIVSIAQDAKPALLLTEHVLVGVLADVQSTIAPLAGVRLLATDIYANAASSADAAVGAGRVIQADQVAMLQYTSGSTSTPKGVMLTHANLMANEAAIYDAFSIRDDDVIVSWLPLFHDMGLIGTLLQPLYAGVSAVLMAPQHFMERPRRWLDAISQYGGTVSGAPDFAYRLCARRVDPSPSEGRPLDLSSWRLAFCGAEPVREQTLEAFADKFAATGFDHRALYPCYGLAEATLIVTGGKRGQGVRSRAFNAAELRKDRAVPAAQGQYLVSCGASRAEHRVLIADNTTGQELAAGQVGEIQVAGPSIARGYWDNTEATERTFIVRDGRIFLRTGDLGFVQDGELYVTGRQKDMIIVRGLNHYPQDIEHAIEQENAVVRSGRVVAFSLDHAGAEGIGVAAEINPRFLKLIEPENVCRELTQLVASIFGEPPHLVLLLSPGTVPLTSSGKLQRAACRQAWLDRELSVVAAYGAAAAGFTPPARAVAASTTHA